MSPVPGLQSIVIDTNYGHARTNQSRIPGRILRDYENHWMPSAVRQALEAVLAEAQRPRTGLCIPVFEADSDRVAGQVSRDLSWWTGYLVAVAHCDPMDRLARVGSLCGNGRWYHTRLHLGKPAPMESRALGLQKRCK